MMLKQIRTLRGCLSYTVCDDATGDCLIIDPSVEAGDAYDGVKARYIVETHTHADHISAGPEIASKTGATVVRERDDGSTIALGTTVVRVIETPGHTDDSISLVVGSNVFTGDALMIGTTGRTDFQQGSSEKLYESLWHNILPLGDDVIVWPAHDYKGRESTTVGAEKSSNPRLQMSRDEFIKFMDAYHPEKPELFEEAITKNTL